MRSTPPLFVFRGTNLKQRQRDHRRHGAVGRRVASVCRAHWARIGTTHVRRRQSTAAGGECQGQTSVFVHALVRMQSKRQKVTYHQHPMALSCCARTRLELQVRALALAGCRRGHLRPCTGPGRGNTRVIRSFAARNKEQKGGHSSSTGSAGWWACRWNPWGECARGRCLRSWRDPECTLNILPPPPKYSSQRLVIWVS